jgi:YHS domain-containing protein
LLRHPQRRLAVRSFSDDLQLRIQLDETAQPFADHLVIVCDQYSNGHKTPFGFRRFLGGLGSHDAGFRLAVKSVALVCSASHLKVRLETGNPGYALRPDMFVDVEFQVERPPMLTVPPDAVVDTGLHKTLFVDLGEGRFQPREVITGERFEDQVEIVKGVSEGERVVVSANFLLDSESRMQAAAMGLHDSAVDDPACGMKVDPIKAGDKRSVYEGVTYYFCSVLCKSRFDADPARYLKGESGGRRIQKAEVRTCVCNSGMRMP